MVTVKEIYNKESLDLVSGGHSDCSCYHVPLTKGEYWKDSHTGDVLKDACHEWCCVDPFLSSKIDTRKWNGWWGVEYFECGPILQPYLEELLKKNEKCKVDI